MEGPVEGSARAAASLWVSDKAFVLIFALLAIAAVVPIWRVRFLPLLDLPNHLAAVYIWHNFDEPWSRAGEFYELSIKPAPYCAYHVLTHVLAYAAGLENANRIVLSGYVVSIPAIALWWTRRTGRSPWLSVLTFPLAFSLCWACGFLPFLVGVTLLLGAIAALDAWLSRPTVPGAVAVALLSLGCGLGHPLTLFAYYVGVAVLLLCHHPRWTRLGVTLLLFAPAAALFVWQVLAFKSPLVDAQRGPRFQGAWVPWRELVTSFPAYTLDAVTGDLDIGVFWVMLASASALFLWGLVAGLRARRAAPPPGRRSLSDTARDCRSLLLAAAMMACYFIVPLHLARPFDWWFVSGRFTPFICFFGFLSPKAPLRGIHRLVMAPAVVAALLLPLHLSEKYADFDERLKPFARMVERVPPGANVLFLALPPRTDDAVIIEATNHFSSWVQIMHGGFSADGWFNVGFPFLLKHALPAPPANRNERFDPTVHAAPYDYVIVRNDKPGRPIFTAQHRDWHRIEREGAFTMYGRMTPR